MSVHALEDYSQLKHTMAKLVVDGGRASARPARPQASSRPPPACSSAAGLLEPGTRVVVLELRRAGQGRARATGGESSTAARAAILRTPSTRRDARGRRLAHGRPGDGRRRARRRPAGGHDRRVRRVPGAVAGAIPGSATRCGYAASTTPGLRDDRGMGQSATSSSPRTRGGGSCGARVWTATEARGQPVRASDRGRVRDRRPRHDGGGPRRGPRRPGAGRRSTATTRPTRSARCATTCARSRSSSPTAPASRSTAGRSSGRSGRSGSASRRARASCCTTVGYDDGDRVRPVLHRASFSELFVPYGDPGPGQLSAQRVRHRRVRARAADQLARARLRLPRRDPLLRRRARRRRRPARTRSATRSACTRRTPGCSGSTPTP